MQNSIIYSRRDQTPSQTSPYGFMDYIYKYSNEDQSTGKFLDDLVGGSSSGYGHTKSCGINLAILVTALAGIAAMAYVLYTKITMKGRKRKKRELLNLSKNWDDHTLHDLSDIVFGGNTRLFYNTKGLICMKVKLKYG